MNRREVIKRGATLAAGVLVTPQLFSAHHGHQFKIGACDWSIKRMLELEAFRMGQDLGLDGIQYSFDETGRGWDLRTKENREAVRNVVKATGVAMSSLAIGLLNKIPFASTERGEELVVECIQAMATMKREAVQLDDAELAAKVAPNLVLLAFFNKGDINGKPELIAKVIEKLKRVTPMAEKHGFTLGLETWLNESDHRHILESVDSPAVKVYYDVANSNKMGYDIYKEIQSLGPGNICEIHCKENGFLLGRGRIAFERLRGVIKNIGYKGWLIIESATPKNMEVGKAYQHNLNYLRSVF
jgi:L-ribulose-5-phosphate 3-epimerase